MSHLYQLELSSRIGEMFQFFANVQDFFESSKFIKIFFRKNYPVMIKK